MANEVWRNILGYEEYYQVSSFGKIRSIDRQVGSRWGGTRPYKGRIMAISNSVGYNRVMLAMSGVRKWKSCHRAVAEAFIPNPNNYSVINHKDGNKINNHVDNLEWTTIQGNTKHAYDNGKIPHLLKYMLMKGNIPHNARTFLNKENGIYYESNLDAAFSLGICLETLNRRIRSKRGLIIAT